MTWPIYIYIYEFTNLRYSTTVTTIELIIEIKELVSSFDLIIIKVDFIQWGLTALIVYSEHPSNYAHVFFFVVFCSICCVLLSLSFTDILQGYVTSTQAMIYDWPKICYCDTLRLRLNCIHFAEDIFKCIFFNENAWNLLKSSLKLVRKVWINKIGTDNGFVPVRQQAIIWTNDGLVYWCIYASLGLNELSNAEEYQLSYGYSSYL